MENKLGYSDGDEIPKRKRTLDLKSIYGSESLEGVNVSGDVGERVNSVEDDNISGEGRKRKRKKVGSIKAAGINSVENSGRKSDKSLDEVYSDGIGISLATDGTVKTQLAVSQKSNSSRSNDSAKNSDHISLSLEDNVAKIPKRKRDIVRRKQVELHKTKKVPGGKLDTDSSQAAGQTAGLASDPCSGVDKKTAIDSEEEHLKTTLEKKLEHLKENSTRRSKKASLLHYAKLGISDLVGGSSDLTIKNKQKKRKRKSKDDVHLSFDTGKESSSPVRMPIDISGNLLDDEEENLEQNAARMLSSRFNPNLTGFSCDRKDSSNDFSMEQSARAGFRIHSESAVDDSDSALDDNGIVLRPRKELKAKSLSRKRRHFYEVVSEDLDPCWVLKKRIKVFWPLDKSWYIGLIKDYDPKKKRHHVKYEDREEEWIDLRSERFKLLLFPSEIPSKAEKTRSLVRGFQSEPKKVVVDTVKSNGVGNFKDTEPIISWLSRTNKKLKTTSSVYVRNYESRKETHSGSEGARRQSNGDNNPSAEASYPVDLRNIHGVHGMTNDESDSLRIVNFPAVYSRRRFDSHKKCVNSEDGLMFKFAPDQVAYFDHLIENSLKRGEIDAFMGHEDNVNPPLAVADIDELLGQLYITNLHDFKLDVNLPGFPVLERVPLVDNCWLLHSIFILQYGTIYCLWPKVQLEILFVDNSAGVKLFLFDKCLIQAVAILFRIFSTFRHYPESGKYIDMQTPITSLRIKFASPYDPKKKISYSFSFFSQLRDTEWSYLDFELKKQCLLMKQLDLPECAYDNIDALHLCKPMSGTVSSKEWPSAENEGKCKEHSLFGVSSSNLLEQHLERLIGPRISYNNSIVSDSFPSSECTETSGKCIVNCYPEPCDASIEIDSHNGSKTLVEHNVSGRNCSDQKVAIKTVDFIKKNSRKDSCNGSRSGTPSSLLSRKAMQINDRSCHQIDFNRSGPKLLSLTSPILQDTSNSGRQLRLNGHGTNISLSGSTNDNGDEKASVVDLAGQLKQGVCFRNNPTAPRSMGRRTKNISPSFGPFSRAWHVGQTEVDRNGCKSGTKKLRTGTQASNSLPDVDTGCNSKQRIPPLQEHAHKKMKKSQENKTVDSPRSPRKNLDLLPCAGNILIILEDRCWRESEAQVFLQPADHNEWVLSVKVAGIEKYTYKANQLLQSGATNRFTYAMMWKGGKDWTFEFPDRSQWVLFKELHNECYNRNLRAGSVKIIPIPGVRLVDDFDDNISEATPFSFHPIYYLQSETDVEIALNPSRVLYDMDSEDEQWLSNNQMSSEDNGGEELVLSEEFFEKMMDMLEKAAYVRKHDQFTRQEIEDLFVGVGPISFIMKIHDYWSQKRQRTGMPLIRQFQPPLWERYQKQLQEWERAVGRFSHPLLSGGNKPLMPEKPPMFAFCLKPRGLEVTSRGTKQRTHKKYHGPGHISTTMGDHDGYHAYGRRYNRYIYVDEKVTSSGSYDSEFSPRLISPRDGSMAYFSMSNGFDRDHQQRPYRIKSKKIGSLMVPFQPLSYNPQATAMNIESSQRKTGYPYWPHQKMMYPQSQSHPRFLTDQLDGPDLEEFKLRDASGAAQHARVMAKLKRQKAERLHYRADLAMQKAMVALNIAKAIKVSQGASAD